MRYAIILPLILLFAGCLQLFPEQEETEETPPTSPPPIVPQPENGSNITITPGPPDVPANISEPEPQPIIPMARFNVTIQNVHSKYSISPQIVIAHKKLASLNYLGKTIPPSFEPLAEYGDPAPYANYIRTQNDVLEVYLPNRTLGPGQSYSLSVSVPQYRPRETQLSVIGMIIESNDGFALADAITLFVENDEPIGSITNAQNYDSGTEENSLPGSGYSGGQPEEGKNNTDNGDPTSPPRPVILHPQFPETIMRVTVVPQ